MPTYFCYQDDYAFSCDRFSLGSMLGLKATQAQCEKEGLTVIHRPYDRKTWRFVDGAWKACK